MNKYIEELSKIDSKRLAKTIFDYAQIDLSMSEKYQMLIVLDSADELKTHVLTRIKDLASGQRYYKYDQACYLANDIDFLRDIIVNEICPKNPMLASDLIEEIIKHQNAIFDTVDDSGCEVGSVFEELARDWSVCWQRVVPRDMNLIIDKIVKTETDYGFYFVDAIIDAFASILGTEGVELVKKKIKKLSC